MLPWRLRSTAPRCPQVPFRRQALSQDTTPRSTSHDREDAVSGQRPRVWHRVVLLFVGDLYHHCRKVGLVCRCLRLVCGAQPGPP